MSVSFEAFEGPGFERAVALARRSPVYREETVARRAVAPRGFDAGEARALRDLFELVKGRPGTEVLSTARRCPTPTSCGCPSSGSSSAGRRRARGPPGRPRPPRRDDPPAPGEVGALLQRRGEEAALGDAGPGGDARPALRQRGDPEQRRALPLPGPQPRATPPSTSSGRRSCARARRARPSASHGLRAEQLPPPAGPRPHRRPRPAPAPRVRGGAEIRVSDPARDAAAVRALYERFVEERRRAGEGQAPAFESFRDLIGKQTERIRAEKGALAVDFRLETKDGKVSLKARIVK